MDEWHHREHLKAAYLYLLRLTYGDTLHFFYSRDCIMSAEAKAQFVEPDLAPLPVSRREFHPGIRAAPRRGPREEQRSAATKTARVGG